MKLNKLLTILSIAVAGSIVVACGSGNTSCDTPPQAPVVTPLDLPPGFVTPAGSTSGIGYSESQIAIPAKGSYNIIQLTPEQRLSVAAALKNGGVIAQQTNGNLVIAAPASAENPTTKAESVVIIVPQTTSAQSKSLQTLASASTYTIPGPGERTTNIDTTSGSLSWAVYGTTNGVVLHNYHTDHQTVTIPKDNAQCPGISNTISLGTNNNSSYISWGTQGNQGKVCVADINSSSACS